MAAASPSVFIDGPVEAPPSAPQPLDPRVVRRALRDVALPCLCPILLKRLQPPRYGSRFDPVATAALVLDDPAVLVALYSRAAHDGVAVDDPDPAQVIERLGPAGIGRIVESLRDCPFTGDDQQRGALAQGYRHALVTARLAADLAPALGVAPRAAAAAALLHDLGRLLLLAGPLATPVMAIHGFIRGAALSSVCIEQTLLGMSHKQIGHDACGRIHAPSLVREVCHTHEHSESQRRQLAGELRAATTLVNAADAIAKAHGVTGSPAAEIVAAPAELASTLRAREAELASTLAGAVAAAEERWGAAPPQDRSLAGWSVDVTGPREQAWSVLPAALRSLGAEASATPWPADGDDRRRSIVVVDCLSASLSEALPVIADLARRRGTRVLVVAERRQEPEERLPTAAPGASWCATPLRHGGLADAVVRLGRAA